MLFDACCGLIVAVSIKSPFYILYSIHVSLLYSLIHNIHSAVAPVDNPCAFSYNKM